MKTDMAWPRSRGLRRPSFASRIVCWRATIGQRWHCHDRTQQSECDAKPHHAADAQVQPPPLQQPLLGHGGGKRCGAIGIDHQHRLLKRRPCGEAAGDQRGPRQRRKAQITKPPHSCCNIEQPCMRLAAGQPGQPACPKQAGGKLDDHQPCQRVGDQQVHGFGIVLA